LRPPAARGPRRPPLAGPRRLQVQVGEDESEDVAVRNFMKSVMQSGVIDSVSAGHPGIAWLAMSLWPSRRRGPPRPALPQPRLALDTRTPACGS